MIMARNFNGISEYITIGSAILTASPMTFSCWFYTNVTDSYQRIISLEVVGVETGWALFIGKGKTPYVNFASNISGVGSIANSRIFYSTGVWQHACGINESTTSRAAFLNGANKGTNTDSSNPTGVNQTRIGAAAYQIKTYFNGKLAEAAVWNAILSDIEVQALGNRISPIRIRPGNLVFYSPLYGIASPEPDWSGKLKNGVLTGTTQANHVPITMPFGFDRFDRYSRQEVPAAGRLSRYHELHGLGGFGQKTFNPMD